MPFTPVPAAQIELLQNAVDGDIFIPSFSRRAFLQGATSGLLSLAPALTMVGNLLTVPAPVRNYDLNTFAGLGLSIQTTVAAGNFPVVASRDVQVNNVASTGHTYTYPSSRRLGQLLVMAVATAALTTITTPSGWTLVQSQAGTESRTSVFERVIDGLEPSTELLAFGTASAAIVRTWMIDIADGGVEAVAGINDSAAGTSLDLATISPTWAATEAANTLYIAILGLADDVTVSAFPASYTVTGQDANASATANLDCALAYAERSALGSSENPGAFTYGASRSTGHIIAIKPKVTARLNWDGLTVRKNSGADVGTRRRVNLIEGAGITLTVSDDAGGAEIDVTITNSGAGGIPTWAETLNEDFRSGTNNPHIDEGQYLSFHNEDALPTVGDIRSSAGLEIEAVGDVLIHTPFNIVLSSHSGAADSVQINADFFRITTGGNERLEIQSDGTWEVNGAGGTSGQYLRSLGVGFPPSWQTISFSEITGGTWADVLSRGNNSGAFNPHVDDGQFLSFGVEGSIPGSGDIRSSDAFTINVTGAAALLGSTTASVTGGGSNGFAASAAAVILGAGTSGITVTNNTFIRLSTGGTERLEIEATGAWQLNGAVGSAGQYMRSAGAGTTPLWATIAASEISGIVATTGAVSIPAGGGASLFAGILDNGAAETDRAALNFLSTTSIIAVITDDGVNNELELTWQRAALSGAISAAQNVNTTQFSGIRDNSTLETARGFLNFISTTHITTVITQDAVSDELEITSAWNGVAARRNSGTTLTARHAFNFIEGANISLTVASDAVDDENEITIAVTGITSSGAVTGAISHAAGGGASLFAGIRDNGTAENDRTNLNFLSSTSVIAAVTDDSGNDELELTWQVAAYTGAIAKAQNGTTTTFAGIRNNGSAENDRTNLNFLNSSTLNAVVTDDAGADELEISFTIASGAITDVHVSASADIEPSKIGHTVLIQSGTVNAAPLGDHDTAIQLNGTTTLNGIANGYAGREIDVYCATSGTLTANHASGSAAATDQLFLAGGVAYGPVTRGGIRLRYDGVNSVWREVSRADTSVSLIQVSSIYAADASITITPPTGATWFEFEIVAAGGGGGGADADGATESIAAGGGGSGETVRGIVAIVSGNITGSTGTSGTAGSNVGGNGGVGGDTVLTYNAVSYTADGGQGGTGSATGAATTGTAFALLGGNGGTNGTASTADIQYLAGMQGAPGIMFFGAAAGNSMAIGGLGGMSLWSGGNTGAVQNNATGASAGGNASGPGAGGSGAVDIGTAAGTGVVGGIGGTGAMIIRFYSGTVPTRTTIT